MPYKTTIPRYRMHIPEVNFDKLPEMAPFLDEPLGMYVGAPGKHGYLKMGFEIDPRGKCIMRTLDRRAPIIVQQELYFDEEMPEMPCVYILASGGPYVNGDRFQQDVVMEKDSFAFVSTGAATKIASMKQNYVGMIQHFTLKENSYLEFLPEPIFPGLHSRFASDTEITIDPTATLVYSEIYMSGRKYYKRFCPQGEIFTYDLLSVCAHARRPEGGELFREKFLIEPYRRFPKTVGVMDKYDVFANLLILTPEDKAEEIYSRIEPFIDRGKGLALGITTLPSQAGLLVKVLGMEAGPVKALVRETASKVRMAVKGKPIPAEFPWR